MGSETQPFDVALKKRFDENDIAVLSDLSKADKLLIECKGVVKTVSLETLIAFLKAN